MVGTVGTTLSPVFLLWILPQHSAWAAPLGAISLSYKFTITPDGQPWCKIQGQINGNEFLDYNCNSQKNATEVWERQTKTLKGLMGELKKNLLDIKPEIIKIIGIDSFSLQGTMMCKQESNGHNNASWKFGFNGHKSLLFNVENKSWTVLRPEGQPLKETLASDRAMTGELVSIATQDCIDWLQQVSGTQGEVLSTKAPSTIAAATVPSKATTSMPIISILPVILTGLIIAADATKEALVVWTISATLPLLGCLWMTCCSFLEHEEFKPSVQRPGSDQDETVEAASHVCYCIC
ncbi:UL16-binding protein 1-like isoform X2 [Myotis daubentonii]|uniref:UL16-binding protein 1-like isoform X2 n=1 Tax=Myotis daubentonii TaxID=98922 RepID=UPI002873CF14|nr:UL16-binding protein 1-like isoform X2 [Myotis daubentonii]